MCFGKISSKNNPTGCSTIDTLLLCFFLINGFEKKITLCILSVHWNESKLRAISSIAMTLQKPCTVHQDKNTGKLVRHLSRTNVLMLLIHIKSYRSNLKIILVMFEIFTIFGVTENVSMISELPSSLVSIARKNKT